MNFIERYDGALTSLECESLIRIFENCSSKKKGKSGGVVDPTLKISTAMDLYFNEDNLVNNVIVPPLKKCLNKYRKKYPLIDGMGAWKNENNYQIQKYEEDEGYFVKHCEQANISTSKRILVWMIYLNNAQSGTRFYHQRIDMKPRTGRLVLWPAAWTHTHSGITPNKGNKYIVTGWFELTDNDK